MDLVIWIIDKVFILLIMWVGMKVFDRKIRVLIADTIQFVKGGAGGKMPGWKDAVGVFLYGVAEKAADPIGDAIVDAVRGGLRPGQSK
jgi:hypothetical protein